MAEESDLERTEPASARRLERAREEGQVPRSREVGAFLILIVAAVAFWFIGPWMVQRMAAVFRRGLAFDHGLTREPQLMLVRLADLSWNEPGEAAVRNYKKGQDVEAIVLAVDVERERISLGRPAVAVLCW